MANRSRFPLLAAVVCIDECTFAGGGSILSGAGRTLDDFPQRFRAESIAPDVYTAADATADVTIDGTPILWSHPPPTTSRLTNGTSPDDGTSGGSHRAG